MDVGAVEKRSEVVQSQEVHWYVHEEGLAYIDRVRLKTSSKKLRVNNLHF